MSTAPVILFVYNRPEHTRRTLESLAENKLAGSSVLYVFADGPRADASADAKRLIAETREVVRSRQWCAAVHFSESDRNKGLAASVVEGVSAVIAKHGRAIVLEDDMVTAPGFLEFMNASLDRYAADGNVACISGYVYPLAQRLDTAFFVKGADCWGWATWSDRWNAFNAKSQGLKQKIVEKDLLAEFTFNGSYPYMQMLTDREEGRNQSWAILWYAWALVNNKLCLYPPTSLVHNTGNDGSGTHSVQASDKFDVRFTGGEVRFPSGVNESAEGRKAFEEFFTSLTRGQGGIYDRIIGKIKRLFSR